MRIIHVVGARPNFMKIAPLMSEMDKKPEKFTQWLVHTGQHYDDNMSHIFFEELSLPKPDVNLGIGSASHAQQTAQVMMAFEPVLLAYRPDLVVVVGDVNSTLACALVATKLHVCVAHIEAGLRSFDRRMPEEINRLLTDQIAELLFTTERDANENLLREGVGQNKIHFVGNLMIDTLLRHQAQASSMAIPERFGQRHGTFALLTLHRPSNVDNTETLRGILDALAEIQRQVPIIFPAHPRTCKRIQDYGFSERLSAMRNLQIVKPMGYLDFLNLMSNARLVLTDSGGIQEETTILGTPCLTLRENTERPVTVKEGTNTLVGTDPEKIVKETLAALDGKSKTGSVPELWDGQAASRVVALIDKES